VTSVIEVAAIHTVTSQVAVPSELLTEWPDAERLRRT
jgi:hypothetical protein